MSDYYGLNLEVQEDDRRTLALSFLLFSPILLLLLLFALAFQISRCLVGEERAISYFNRLCGEEFEGMVVP